MELSLLLNALRRRPIGVLCACVLLAITATLASVDVPTTVVTWLVISAIALGIWWRAEGLLLRLSGCRPLTAREHETLKTALEGLGQEPWIVDRAEAWIVRGLHSTVIGSGVIDLLDDRQLRAVLFQAERLEPTAVAAELVVWSALLPFKAAWVVNGWIARLGRLLAVVVGMTLVVPMVIWRDAYLLWAGRLLAAMLGGMLGSLLLSSGMALLGLLLMTSWAVVPAMRALLAWEWRRAVRRADESVIEAGLGWELLGALDDLVWLDPQPVPPGLVGLLSRVGSPIRERVNHIWRALSESPEH